MGTDYGKLTLGGVYSEQSDYSDQDWGLSQWEAYEFRPDEGGTYKASVGTGAAETIQTYGMVTLQALAVQNTDSTNSVTAAVKTAGSASAEDHVIGPGKIAVFPDVDLATAPTLQATGAAVLCKIAVWGTKT